MLESPKTFAVNTPKALVRYLCTVVKVVNDQEKRIIQLEKDVDAFKESTAAAPADETETKQPEQAEGKPEETAAAPVDETETGKDNADV